jgi:hypothetical protein
MNDVFLYCAMLGCNVQGLPRPCSELLLMTWLGRRLSLLVAHVGGQLKSASSRPDSFHL